MASPFSNETLLKWAAGIASFIFGLGVMYAKARKEIESLRKQSDDHAKRLIDIESNQSKSVRHEDLKVLKTEMTERMDAIEIGQREAFKDFADRQEVYFSRFEQHQQNQLELITKLIDVATRSRI